MSEEEKQIPAAAAEPEQNAEASAAEQAEAPKLPAYFLITDDFTLNIVAVGTETGEIPVELHAGDVLRLTQDAAELNGAPAVTAEQLAAFGEKASLCVNAHTIAKAAEHGEETDEAFYLKNTAQEAAEQPAGAVSADAEKPKEEQKEEEAYTAKQLLEDALDLIESVMASVFVVMMLFTFVFCVATVEGESMVPTLASGDRLMVNRLFHNYDRGDILILNSKTAYIMNKETGEFHESKGLGKRIVKRLIAKAGEEVNIDFAEGIVYVNGQALDEPYVNTLTNRDNGAFNYPFTVPEGYVFVLGDNRNISRDSRHPDVGLVPTEDIIGSVVIRLTPFANFGKVN